MPEPTPPPTSLPASLAKFAALIGAYSIGGWIGLSVPYVGSHISLLWPPTGIAVAALLRWGPRYWPAVWLGACLVNLSVGSSLPLAAGIACGNTLGPWLAAWLLRRRGFHVELDRRRDLFDYLLIAVIGSMLITASNGIVNLVAAGLLVSKAAPTAWLYWWLGDAIGVLLVGVPLLTCNHRNISRAFTGGRSAETLLLVGLLAIFAFLLFSGLVRPETPISPLVFAPLLLLCWLAARSGLWVASAAALIFSVIAAWATAHGYGPFTASDMHASLFLLWGYMATMTIIIVLLTALVAELASSDERWELALETANTGVWEWYLPTNKVFYSRQWKAMLGYQAHDIGDDLQTWETRVHPDDLAACHQAVQALLDGRIDNYQHQFRMRCKDGSWLWIESQGKIIEYCNSGQPLRIIGTHTDITERQRAAQQLRLAAGVFEHTHEGILITDASGNIIDVNHAFTTLTGYHHDEVIGQRPNLLKSGQHSEAFYAELWETLLRTGFWQGEVWSRKKDGEVFAELLAITAVKDGGGATSHYIGMFSDITPLKEHQHRLEHMAHYDALTQLPNRVLFADRLQQALLQSQQTQSMLAVCYLDLDGFKAINDQFGHSVGDRLLVEVASRLKNSLRAGDSVARLGGDEFALLISGLHDCIDCRDTLEQLLGEIARPYLINQEPLLISASIGVTLYPTDDASADALLRHADQAMYLAKQAGRNRYYLFDPEHDRRTRNQHEALGRIEQALIDEELRLFYQPKVNMRTGEVIGAEALIRWQHPERGLLPPGEFLPMTEDTASAVHIGDWVLNEALRQMSAWQAAGLTLAISVNIAGRHLQEANFADRLAELLRRYPEVAPQQLELEVLETTALEDIALMSQVIEQCRTLGVTFALDDFGTGYSSLTYFRRLPANLLKIDQTFIRDMLEDPEDLAIVEGVIGLTRAFQRQVIAEGVETPEHGAMLLQLGCDLAQGYGIARPMPAAQLPPWIASYQPPRLWQVSASERWSRDHLQLLSIGLEHRRWSEALLAYLEQPASNEAPASLPPEHCNFGRWYYHQGRERYGKLMTFAALGPTHEQVHQLSELLINSQRNGEKAVVDHEQDRLRLLRDTLIDQLYALQIEALVEHHG